MVFCDLVFCLSIILVIYYPGVSIWMCSIPFGRKSAIIHFENYGKVLEKDLDVSAYIEEHRGLTYDLSKISHRFRIFLLVEFLVVTASQFVTLLQTTENQSVINLINGGDFAVSLPLLQQNII